LNVRASHLTTKRRRHSPPRGIKDPWARPLLVTTSLPACPLFYGSKIVVVSLFYIFGKFFISFYFGFFPNIIAVRIGTYLTVLKIRRTQVRTTT